ncbi:MAG: peptidase S10 [Candidatus Eremiobacteraeota bacterium]|nr:peptidase S10 [Candidatus Eremiobacteraeota bacterium]
MKRRHNHATLAALVLLSCLAAAPRSASMPAPPERSVHTHHAIAINGQTIPYTATAGTILLRGERHEPTASVFYVAYTKEGAAAERRPVTFCYNGGPGSSTIWLHMGSIGPKRVITPDAQAAPAAPFGLRDNPYSLLDKTDLVFVDAVGTGFSRLVGKGSGKAFWGVDEDVEAFGQFIERYVTRNSRWNSPKFLFGESYGTTRSANLVNYLQNRGMAFNGVVLVSTVLNFATLISQSGNDLPYIAFLPTQAAAAWYHNRLAQRPSDLASFVAEVRRFAGGDYADALIKGDSVSPSQQNAIVASLHRYTGLSESYIRESKLRIPPDRFEKELLRGSEQTVGRLDARFLGYDLDVMGDSPDYDPSDVAVSAAFVGAFNDYIRNALHYRSDEHYYPTHYDVVNRGWNWNRGERSRPTATNVADDLQEAMTKNPHLRVFSANGYYDFATPFYGTEYTLSHLSLPPALQSHITYGYYESGHMIYLHTPSLAKLKSDLSRFYDLASP